MSGNRKEGSPEPSQKESKLRRSKMNEIKTLGTNLRRLRLSSGLTQKELGMKVGLTKGTISKLELGKQGDIEIKYLLLICQTLGVSIEEFFIKNAKTIKLTISDENVQMLGKIFSLIKEMLAQKKE